MAINIKADIKTASIRADIQSGATVRVTTTSPIVKTTTIQNVVKAVVKDAGPQGPPGPQGPQGAQGLGSNVRNYTWVIDNPAVGGIPGPRLKEAHTVTRIDSYVIAETSVTFNLEERSTIGVTGTDILADDQLADIDGASATSFANSTLAVDSYLWLDISGVSGNPLKVVVTLSGTI